MNIKIFAIVLLVPFLKAFAQQPQTGITMEQTVEFLNQKLAPGIVVQLTEKNSKIVLNFYKNGAIYKIDKIYLETLDTAKISYSTEEKALILRCKNPEQLTGKMKKFKDGCVEREIIEKNIIGAYGRSNLEIGSDKKKIESARKAFVHLIKLVQLEGYSSNVPFE